jgi:hypothetical protein
MKIIRINLCLFLVLVIFSSFVSSYAFRPSYNIGGRYVFTNSISGSHIIYDKDLHSKLYAEIAIEGDYISKWQNITMSFSPFEEGTSLPIKDLQISICKTDGNFYRNEHQGFTEGCVEFYNYSIEHSSWLKKVIYEDGWITRNFSEFYEITFQPQNSSLPQSFIVVINYTTPQFVYKQGDYYVGKIAITDAPSAEKIENIVILPSAYDIPRFWPENAEMKRLSYEEDGKVQVRWAYFFKGPQTQIFWYQNTEELRKAETKSQILYLVIGTVAGFILSLTTPWISKRFKPVKRKSK